MKILRKYCDFMELDGDVSFLDWIIGQHLNFPLINSLCFCVVKDSTSRRLQALGNFSFPVYQRQKAADFLHQEHPHIPTQSSQAAIPCPSSSQKGDWAWIPNKNTPKHTHRTLQQLVNLCSQQSCPLLTLTFGFVCLGHLQNNNKKTQTLMMMWKLPKISMW